MKALNRKFFNPRYILEAILVYLFFAICKLLPLDWASAFGGWLARILGPLMGVSRRADRNLRRAMPELDNPSRKKIIRAMWDNLGRVASEYPHMQDLIRLKRIQGADKAMASDIMGLEQGCIVVGGHLGNWEIGPLVSASMGAPLAVIYRAPNNPYVDWIIKKVRQDVSLLALPKGAEGAIGLLRHIRNKGYAGILIDQKLNEGIPVPFFGQDAYTTPAPAELAIRFGCPLVAFRAIRKAGAYYDVEAVRIPIPKGSNRSENVKALTHTMTALLERWIRETPEQWLWLHNRWPKIRSDQIR